MTRAIDRSGRPRTRPALCAAVFSLLALAWATLATAQSYSGEAYSSATDHLLYTESHWIYTDHAIPRRLVVYRCPDGKPFARKRIDMTPGATTPDFDFEDARTGYAEGVRTRAGQREVFYRMDATSPEHAAPLAARANAVIDAGFDAFIASHWTGFDTPSAARIAFVVPSRLGYVDFAARAGAKDDADADALRRFRLAVASWYGFALPHIDVAYDRASHRLREYRGLSNIRDSRQRNIDVRIEFPAADWHPDVSMDDVDANDRTPLNGRCDAD